MKKTNQQTTLNLRLNLVVPIQAAAHHLIALLQEAHPKLVVTTLAFVVMVKNIKNVVGKTCNTCDGFIEFNKPIHFKRKQASIII